MKPEHKEKVEEALRALTQTLRDELLRTGLVTNLQWNDSIAPKLTNLHMEINEIRVTARTYKVHHSFVEE